MFQIDKKEIGAFVALLRKEKGYMQKDLARELFISDKAVSKWETGNSLPDSSLLLPLAQLLGVSVTELLLCRRLTEEETVPSQQVEQLVQTAVSLPREKTPRAYHGKNRWAAGYLLSLLLGALGLWWCAAGRGLGISLPVITGMSAIFGAYFCLLVKTRLPEFYDQNRIGVFYDGPVRMNLPGVSLNNRNWPHLVRVIRLWCCLTVALPSWLWGIMARLQLSWWSAAERYLAMLPLLVLVRLLTVVGKKYE